MKFILLAFSFCFLQTNIVHAELPPVETAAGVDLHQYIGTWYEIAAIPQSFEEQCTGNTTAVYGFTETELISVVNSCNTATGKRSIADGRAKVVDKITNSKLKVTFANFFGWQFLFAGDYWILAVGENYAYAVVGSPNRDYAWILSRNPSLTESQILEANQVLVKQAFDTCKLITTIQASGLQSRTPLCQLVTGN